MIVKYAKEIMKDKSHNRITKKNNIKSRQGGVNMEQFDETFIEGYCEEMFDEFLSDSTMYLKKTNAEYKKLLNEKRNILDNCPNLERIFDVGELKTDLKAEETKYVHNYDLVMVDLSVLESKEMFIRGMREAYYLFKKLNILK